MKEYVCILLIFVGLTSCQSQKVSDQNKIVGGPCEGCEAVFEYGEKKLSSNDTLPGFEKTDPKLKITGVVYKKDGKTPAKDVILYIYHTNREGLYEAKGNEKGWGKRHGMYRGWIKTDANGVYTFYTFRPAAYPNGRESEHIHITVKEPKRNEYFIDAFVFDDDPLLTPSKRKQMNNRGGSGIVSLKMENGLLVVNRDIVLGMNIPNYD